MFSEEDLIDLYGPNIKKTVWAYETDISERNFNQF